MSFENFFRGDYMPHGHCFLWQPGILWTTVISDVIIALSYFSIPVALVVLVYKRVDIQFKGIYLLFAAFITCCGMTHVLAVYNLWHGAYGIQSILKALTAGISFITAVYIIKNYRVVVQTPSLAAFEEAEKEMLKERFKRQTLELDQKNESIFRFTTEFVPTGLLVVDINQTIRMANLALEKIFGYKPGELNGRPLQDLITAEHQGFHEALVTNYLEHPIQKHSMAAGRLIKGKTADNKEVYAEISLSVHEFQGEKLAFASVIDAGEVINENNISLEGGRLKRALEATNDGIWEWNVETDKVWYSENLMTLLGHSPDDTPNIAFWREHIHPDDYASVQSCLNKHFSHKTPYDIVYRGLTKNGYRWVRAKGDTRFNSDGAPLLMSGTLTDVHDLKTLETELDEKSRFIEELLNRSLCGMYIYSFINDGNSYINPEYTNITGYTLDDLQNIQRSEGFLTLFHPMDTDNLIRHIATIESSTDGVVSEIEYRFKHKKGHWIWCYSRDSVYQKDEHGKTSAMLGTFFDISDLKDRERQLRSLALEYSTTFEQAAVGIAHVDLEGNFIKVNRKLCEILDYDQATLLSLNYSDITHPNDIDDNIKNKENLIKNKIRQYVTEKRYLKQGGSYVWVKLTVAFVEDPVDNQKYFVSVIEDITQQKKIAQELHESNKSLERFAYSASHDLQEPLRKICTFSEILNNSLEEETLSDDAKFQLDRIVNSAQKMSRMINSLLDLARLSKRELKRSNISLSSLVDQVKEDISYLIEQFNVELSTENDLNLYIESDSFQLILQNLFANSIHYKHQHRTPTITVAAKEQFGKTHILITDNGLGIKEEVLPYIFDPFRRFAPPSISGVGMGLAICRQIVIAHKGEIHVVSSSPKGTTFEIILPVINTDEKSYAKNSTD
ncbi:MAG: PAS domain S-box protein [Agarilytica sp.]